MQLKTEMFIKFGTITASIAPTDNNIQTFTAALIQKSLHTRCLCILYDSILLHHINTIKSYTLIYT